MINDAPTLQRLLILAAAMLTASCLISQDELSASQRPRFLGGGDKTVAYRTFRDPAGRFDFEYPMKDWSPQSSVGGTLAIVARNDREATVAIDYSRMALTRPPSSDTDYETLGEFEIQDLKERHPQTKDFTSEIVDTKGGRGVLIRYANVGTKGPERVMQYSIPVGLDLYRVIAIVPEVLLSKHEAVLMHMIKSFQAPASSPNAKN